MSETKDWQIFKTSCYAGYCGPYIEQEYMRFYNSSPAETDRIYLPISWTKCYKFCSAAMKAKLQKFISELDPKYRYFTVIQLDNGLHHPSLTIRVPDNVDILFFSAGGFTTSEKSKNVVIPLLLGHQEKKDVPKTRLASFLGSLHTDPVRQELHDTHKDFILFDKSSNWSSVMESSYFSLCPRGFGPTSFRLAEAIQLGSIPIYVWDKDLLLPFDGLIDWDKFSIIINRKDVKSLVSRMLEVNTTNMLKELDNVSHMFTFDFTTQYINDFLRKEKKMML